MERERMMEAREYPRDALMKSPEAYHTVTKKDSFIYNFQRSCMSTETAWDFDFWSACWLLSIALRNVTVKRPGSPVNMNLYTVFVSKDDRARRTQAINRAVEIGREFLQRGYHNEAYTVVQSKTTIEQIERQLSNQTSVHNTCQIHFTLTELERLVSRNSWPMVALLNDLYERPSVVESLRDDKRGPVRYARPYCTLLGATSPRFVAEAIGATILESAFPARTIWVYNDQPKKRIAWPDEEVDSKGIGMELSRIRGLAKEIKEIPLTDDAVKTFSNWYRQADRSADPFRATFETREDEHILRLAGYLAISEDLWQVGVKHIKHAKDIILYTKESASRLFVGGALDDGVTRGIAKVCEILIEAGAEPVSDRDLKHRMARRFDAEDFRTLMTIMHEMHLVKKLEQPAQRQGRPKTLYLATAALAEPDAVQLILDQYRV